MESDNLASKMVKETLLALGLKREPNYEQFKPRDPVQEARNKIPNMRERAHRELAPVFPFLQEVEQILLKHDVILLEPATRDMFLLIHRLIEDKLNLSEKIDQLTKTMMDEVLKAHLDVSKRNSLHNPSIRY